MNDLYATPKDGDFVRYVDDLVGKAWVAEQAAAARRPATSSVSASSAPARGKSAARSAPAQAPRAGNTAKTGRQPVQKSSYSPGQVVNVKELPPSLAQIAERMRASMGGAERAKSPLSIEMGRAPEDSTPRSQTAGATGTPMAKISTRWWLWIALIVFGPVLFMVLPQSIRLFAVLWVLGMVIRFGGKLFKKKLDS